VFLDDVQTPDAIAASLRLAEQASRRDGVAIAIGHPKQATLTALEVWCARRGDLITAADAIRRKTAREMNAVAVR
jgi:polysaccharide deacetylase 2 family uncharacterized protein YibQ